MKRGLNTYKLRQYLVFLSLTLCIQCCSAQEQTEVASTEHSEKMTWNFNTLEGWEDGSQNVNQDTNYSITDGVLHMFTRANTWDRPKVKTQEKIYKQGMYSWRVFVPEMGVGDKASIGAFIYHDDAHELDFEIGYGSAHVRQGVQAKEQDLVVYMTSQANPFQSIIKTVKRNAWYTLALELKLENDMYVAVWYIDGIEMSRLNLNYGEDTSFYIFCSVENLEFMGDHIPKQDNYGLFDDVEYAPY
ncbi:hypothetical protein [Formosa algae]|uniref:GH16 domain-containing protein n=1 Tax=Formosa algae TaxID=225843 RepID=A0A9X1CB57_9FLAO|nr:hypothetical protein [Formosa algae]MBP1838789.1 hypothetical protein [Formosa algae]MDQ0335289.1 hypothetical protein [Formosa algae]